MSGVYKNKIIKHPSIVFIVTELISLGVGFIFLFSLNNLSNLKEKSFKRKFDCYSKAPSKTLEKISLKKL